MYDSFLHWELGFKISICITSNVTLLCLSMRSKNKFLLPHIHLMKHFYYLYLHRGIELIIHWKLFKCFTITQTVPKWLKFVLYKLGTQYVISSLLMPYISKFLVKRLHTAQISLTMEYNSFQENYLRICLSP